MPFPASWLCLLVRRARKAIGVVEMQSKANATRLFVTAFQQAYKK
jgi:hypothetical protein